MKKEGKRKTVSVGKRRGQSNILQMGSKKNKTKTK